MKTRLIYIFLFVSLQAFSQNISEIEIANEYFSMGDLEKAKELYDQLAKSNQNIPYIHQNYFRVLIDLRRFDEGKNYIEKLIRRFPENFNYSLDLGTLYTRKGELDKAKNHFNKIISKLGDDNYRIRVTAQYFINKQLMEWAIATYIEGRKTMKNDLLFSLEMANIHRILNHRDKMVEEYLNYVIQNPSNINYVKNTLQNLLSEPEEMTSLETLLFERVQKDPGMNIYSDLLIWVNLQQKNFYGAFIQARALDKRLTRDGKKVIDVAIIG